LDVFTFFSSEKKKRIDDNSVFKYNSFILTENANRKTLQYIQVSQKWRTNGALRCRRDYRKRQKNVKKKLLDLFADLEVFESGT
jgi:hypothetical protein